MNNLQSGTEHNPLKEREFKITCTVKKVMKEARGASGTKRDTFILLLIPRESDESSLFMRAYNPYLPEKRQELGVLITSPGIGPCRVAMFPANADCPHPHLVVMSVDAEGPLLLRAAKRGVFSRPDLVHLTILKESEMEETLGSKYY